MNTSRTQAIILRRINYGEADRILTLLTRDYGKLSLIAKGVRKEKSKLAGGIELFSESDISFIQGKGEVGTLVSTRLSRHFGNIHVDLEKMRVMSDFLKRIDAVTETDAGPEFFDLVIDTCLAMNSSLVYREVAEAWSTMRLMILLGEAINLEKDATGNSFSETNTYRFIYEENRFIADQNGDISATLIKFLRVLSVGTPAKLMAIRQVDLLSKQAVDVLSLAYQYHRPHIKRGF